MMKIFFSLIFLFFFMLKLNKMLIQMIYQFYLLILFMMLLMNFSLMNMNNWMSIYYFLGMDHYSYGLILLSMWIICLMMMLSNKMLYNKSFNIYLILINLLMIFLFLCFSSMNLMLFYIFFESSLIPVFFLIMGWGHQIDRIKASLYLMLYTLLGSMPLFFSIMYLYLINKTLMLNMLMLNNLGGIIYFLMILAFLIKMPMYLFHLWLPKAHVEAPVVGSMILAGVMLKLGSYGLLRSMKIMVEMSVLFNKYFIIISLIGGVYSSLICLYQIDMKMLVAYSSVVHMSLVMAGILTLYNLGFSGGFLMMIAHGLCSSGLFCLVNVIYERSYSRSLYINKGMINIFPSLSLMWFFMCSSSLSFPPSLNFFSEIMLLSSLIIWSNLLMMILLFLLFFSASYTLYLYSFSQHGKLILMNYNFMNIKVLEYMVLLLHWIPLNIMFYFMHIYI